MKHIVALGWILNCCVTALYGQTQAVDGEGKSVFQYFTPEDVRLQIAVDEPLALTSTITLDSIRYTVDGRTNVVKYQQITFGASMLNSTDQVLLNDLDGALLGFKVLVGYQRGVGATKLLPLTNGTYAWGVNGDFSMDNINLHDPSDSSTRRENPTGYGITGSILHVRPSATLLGRKLVTNLALTGRVGRTWNKKELTSWVERENVRVGSSVVSFEELDGTYGALDRDVDQVRLAASVPMYWWHINMVPFAVANVVSHRVPEYRFGLFLGGTGTQAAVLELDLPSALGLGVDWSVTPGARASTPNWYISGSFSFKGRK